MREGERESEIIRNKAMRKMKNTDKRQRESKSDGRSAAGLL
jgi:uncharacterized small protein (DUF1192 family)